MLQQLKLAEWHCCVKSAMVLCKSTTKCLCDGGPRQEIGESTTQRKCIGWRNWQRNARRDWITACSSPTSCYKKWLHKKCWSKSIQESIDSDVGYGQKYLEKNTQQNWVFVRATRIEKNVRAEWWIQYFCIVSMRIVRLVHFKESKNYVLSSAVLFPFSTIFSPQTLR